MSGRRPAHDRDITRADPAAAVLVEDEGVGGRALVVQVAEGDGGGLQEELAAAAVLGDLAALLVDEPRAHPRQQRAGRADHDVVLGRADRHRARLRHPVALAQLDRRERLQHVLVRLGAQRRRARVDEAHAAQVVLGAEVLVSEELDDDWWDLGRVSECFLFHFLLLFLHILLSYHAGEIGELKWQR